MEMPGISPPAKILVTGANGYIAAWVVRTLLEAGYSVRGAVRSKSKAAHLEGLFKSYGDKFEAVVIEDITKDGAFDEAVRDVDAIEHTASPVTLEADDPSELIDPAVKGSIGILHSALKHAPNLRRVVVTSSCAAVMTPLPHTKTFNENDWNDAAVETVQREGAKAPGMTKYRASKTLAERAIWEFAEKHKAEAKWDVVVINPPWVLGPIIHEVTTPSSLNASMKTLWTNVIEHAPPDALKFSGAWVDVRDLATAHLRAVQNPDAGGERIIVSAGAFFWQDWLDAANALAPALCVSKLQQGTPGLGAHTEPQLRYDNSKAARLLGMKYRALDETARDILQDFVKRGWLN